MRNKLTACRATVRIITGLLFLVFMPTTHAEGPYRLKPGANGPLCIGCHESFTEIMSRPFVHQPMAGGDCSSCHNAHASKHGSLLTDGGASICTGCHEEIAKAGAQTGHLLPGERQCVACHDPHAAANNMGLVQSGSDLCYSCHLQLEERVKKVSIVHEPVTESCLACHSAHGSDSASHLLKEQEPALCLACHEPDGRFLDRHSGIPVEHARCSSCHDPHGSDIAGLLHANVHQPFQDKPCTACHEPSSDNRSINLKKTILEGCNECHAALITQILSNKRVHWTLVDGKSCVNCHAPHASATKALLIASTLELCGRCHMDTIDRQKRSQTRHPPVAEGDCSACHDPHGSDNVLLLKQTPDLGLCGKCHEWQAHSTHPIGPSVIDPRNQNVTLQCSSCHRSHGTEFKHFIFNRTIEESCLECHVKYRR